MDGKRYEPTFGERVADCFAWMNPALRKLVGGTALLLTLSLALVALY